VNVHTKVMLGLRCCCTLLPLLPGISKALESSYTRVLAQQLKQDGIMVNACCPG
jgi:hypothetical protein